MYSGKTLANYFYGIRAWHLLHGQPWLAQQGEITLALEGAKRLAPPASKRLKRAPFTIDIITSIRSTLDLNLPLHAAVFACLTTSFFTIARTGEFTEEDRNGFRVTVFRLPRTKTSLDGEDVYWAEQSGQADPKAALRQHLVVNNPPPSAHLFSWRHHGGLRPLTRGEFLKCLQAAGDRLGLEGLKGHGIRIGGTLEYLLRGVSFESVKAMGRWNSDAFILYLRQHAVVLAPYLQDNPVLEPFTRLTLP
ncbi:hypothetical protein P692DRAFT_20877960 [Suillus brevipes Sb2]|nr:hypothetical protein P692DRAFT_20877960 [Suillus brevipes Sb2]